MLRLSVLSDIFYNKILIPTYTVHGKTIAGNESDLQKKMFANCLIHETCLQLQILLSPFANWIMELSWEPAPQIMAWSMPHIMPIFKLTKLITHAMIYNAWKANMFITLCICNISSTPIWSFLSQMMLCIKLDTNFCVFIPALVRLTKWSWWRIFYL